MAGKKKKGKVAGATDVAAKGTAAAKRAETDAEERDAPATDDDADDPAAGTPASDDASPRAKRKSSARGSTSRSKKRTAAVGNDRDDAPPSATLPAPASATLPAWYNKHFLLGLVVPMVIALVEMWRVKQFTVDDSYISFRYARNFARGLGLVYNEGERVEGYTNFLWTVLLGIGIKLGLDPVSLSKFLGATCLFGSLVLLYRISDRLRPHAAAPCLATWLLATSAPNTGYAVFGLETSLFVFLVLAGIYLFFREEEKFGGAPSTGGGLASIPWSGLVFGLAGLTRPEAPMYLGVIMLFLGRSFFARKNLLRGTLFVAVVGAHLLFRHSYYGAWVPNTLGAKTGNLHNQLYGGWDYVMRWVKHTGPLSALIAVGVAYAIWKRQRALLAIATLTVLVLAYVILVGGDWMQNFRFLVPFEPLAFLLIDAAIRDGWDRLAKHSRAGVLVPMTTIIAIAFGGWRARELGVMHRFLLATEDRFWKMAAGGTAKLFLQQPRDTIAMGDIGYVGYATDYPILDLLGLVDAQIAKMPGGYTQKVGPEWLDYFFKRRPRYAIVISSQLDCQHPSVYGSVIMYNDPRFHMMYQRLAAQPLDNNYAWCIYELRGVRPPTQTTAAPPSIPLLPPEPSSGPSSEPSSEPAPSSEAPRPE